MQTFRMDTDYSEVLVDLQIRRDPLDLVLVVEVPQQHVPLVVLKPQLVKRLRQLFVVFLS